MPKMKVKKNGEKQDKGKKNDSSATSADKNDSDDREKDLYLTQIRYLNDKSERYQLKCDELERQKKDLNSQFSALENEKKDIVEYLKRSLLDREDEVDELTERLERQQQAADKDRDALQLQHSQLRQELQDQIEELAAEKKTLVARIADVEEFINQKEQLMSNMESLEKQLVSQKEEYKAVIHSLEIKALMEKKRLEEEMQRKAVVMAAEAEHAANQKVPETTKLALENTEMKARFSQLSEQILVLMGENSALRDRKSQLSVDVDILEQTLSEMSRQSCIRKKGMEQLTEKCQQLQTELKDCRQEFEQLQINQTGVLAEMEALRNDQASLSEQCRKSTAELRRLEGELQEEMRRRSRMDSITQEAGLTLRQALMDVPNNQDSGVESVLQWKQLMRKLLVVLDQETLTSAQRNQLNDLQKSDPTASGAEFIEPALRFQFDLTHNRPGELGLVHRPTLTQKRILCGIGTGFGFTHVPLHRKPPSQKTAGNSNHTDSPGRFLTSRNFTKPK